jgi:bacterioferritin-associated ferredoxin
MYICVCNAVTDPEIRECTRACVADAPAARAFAAGD